MTIGAIVGGTVGGGLGADTLIVNGKVTGAEVLMSSKSDPNSSSDKADSLRFLAQFEQHHLCRCWC